MLTRPQLSGLQTQQGNLLPQDVSIWISVVSPLLAGLKCIWFSSPLPSPAALQSHKINRGPVYLGSRSAANFQLPTPGLSGALVQTGFCHPEHV